jgi:hypothetical protein
MLSLKSEKLNLSILQDFFLHGCEMCFLMLIEAVVSRCKKRKAIKLLLHRDIVYWLPCCSMNRLTVKFKMMK